MHRGGVSAERRKLLQLKIRLSAESRYGFTFYLRKSA